MAILVFLMTLLLGLGLVAKASQSGNATFTFGFLWGSVVFSDEAHPLDTITCNLTVGAYIDVNIYNFTLEVSGFTGQGWRSFGTEQITSYNLLQEQNLTRQLILTLPENTSGKLHYVLEASTDKGFGNTAFYGTSVLAVTYEELSERYDELLANHTTLQARYDQLLSNYTALNQTFNSLLTDYNAARTTCSLLNSSYQSLNANYTSLKSDYDSLQQDHTYLEEKYDASTAELTVVRYLMFALGVATVILAATTVYFRKKAPYIVLHKETAAKPDDQ
jgi:hypothetical protein